MKKLGIKQNLLSMFHPQTDGLSEQKNQWIEQYLRIMTSLHPTDWTEWISIVLIIHNNRRNATTGLAPNQILLGYEPTLNPLGGTHIQQSDCQGTYLGDGKMPSRSNSGPESNRLYSHGLSHLISPWKPSMVRGN